MTEKVFWQDPYLSELKSIVTQINGNEIQLSKTIFYAESGGQESDSGTIGGINVIKAIKNGKSITYILEKQPDFKEGDEVEIFIDWNRRYSLMKLHFAAEVILELFTQKYSDIEKIGAHISEDKSRIDFLWEENINPILPEIEKSAQKIIESNFDIQSQFCDEVNERRYWEVDGFAKVSCGGTHLKKTSEVGKIRLKRKNLGKNKERVEISLVD